MRYFYKLSFFLLRPSPPLLYNLSIPHPTAHPVLLPQKSPFLSPHKILRSPVHLFLSPPVLFCFFFILYVIIFLLCLGDRGYFCSLVFLMWSFIRRFLESLNDEGRSVPALSVFPNTLFFSHLYTSNLYSFHRTQFHTGNFHKTESPSAVLPREQIFSPYPPPMTSTPTSKQFQTPPPRFKNKSPILSHRPETFFFLFPSLSFFSFKPSPLWYDNSRPYFNASTK